VNYRHAYHAGNFADVVKHAVLALIVEHLLKKETPFRSIDTHAGIGLYDLSAEAERTGEWREGVGRLRAATPPPEVERLLAPYRKALDAADRDGQGRFYPGSPEVVRALARPEDRLVLCELHPEDAAALGRRYARDRRVRVIEIDGWTGLNAYVPPKERRGLVLIDPPFEKPGEFQRMTDGLARAHAKWPTGTYALWYPVKDPLETEAFGQALERTGIAKILRAELFIRRPNDPARLSGCGMIVVNPPWTLAADLEVLLPWLSDLLRQETGARSRVGWLTNES